MKHTRRGRPLIAALLALCVGLLPAAAWAAEEFPTGSINYIYCTEDTVIDVSNASGTIYVTVKNDGCTITLTGESDSKINVQIGYNNDKNKMGVLPEELILSNFRTSGEIYAPYYHLDEDSTLNVEIDGTVEVGSFRGGNQSQIDSKEAISVSLSGGENSIFHVGTMRANNLALNNCTINNAKEISGGKSLKISGCTVSMSGDAEITANNISIDGSTLSNVQEIYAFSDTADDDTFDTTSIEIKDNSTIGMTGRIYNANDITIDGSKVNYTGNCDFERLGGLFLNLNIKNSTITGAETGGKQYPAIGLNLWSWNNWSGNAVATSPSITIDNSTVSATGGQSGPAIGRGDWPHVNHPPMTIDIKNGSNITAIAEKGAGIGSGAISRDKTVGKLTINIAGSTVNASSVSGAGIGSGFSGNGVDADVSTDVTISGTSTVTAVSQHGAGIGAGQKGTTSGTGIPVEFETGIKGWDDKNDSGSAEVGNTDSTSAGVSLYANDEDALGTNSGTLTISGGTVKAESGVKAVSLTVSADKPMMEYTLADDDDIPSVTTPINRTPSDGGSTTSDDLHSGYRSLAFWPVEAGTYTLSYGSGDDPDPLLDVNNEYASTYTLTAPSAESSALAAYEVVRQQKLSGSVGLKDNSEQKITGSIAAEQYIAIDVTGITPSVGTGQSLTYQWYKDGQKIEGADDPNYTPSEPGVYFCAVTGTGLYRGTLNSQAVTVTESGSTAPTAPTMASNTADSITLTEVNGYQYGIVTSSGIDWQTTPEFTNLTRNTEYSFVQKSGEDGPVSAAASFSTLPGKPSESDLQIDYVNETFTLTGGVTAYTDNDCKTPIGDGDPNSSITDYIGETVYLKYDDVTISGNVDEVVTAVKIPPRPAAPELSASNISASDTSLSLTGEDGVTYAIFENGESGTPKQQITCTAEGQTITFDNLTASTTYTIRARIPASNEAPGHFHSQQAVTSTTTTAPLIRIGITPVATTFNYTGSPIDFQFTTNPANLTGFTVEYYRLSDVTKLESAPSDVGSYSAVITRAADGNYAAVKATFTLTITAGEQTAPDAPEAEAVTATSITLKAPEDSEGKAVEYAYVMGANGSAEKLDENAWTSNASFGSLQPGTAYTFFARYAEGGNYDASPASIGTAIYTLPNTPAAGVGYTIDYEQETATASATYEISTDGTTWNEGTINITPGGALYVRVKSNGDIPASESRTNTLPARPAAPTGITGGNNQISGLDTTMEYSTDGTAWTKVEADDLSNGVLSNLEAGEYWVRFAAKSDAFASESVAVTVTNPYIPPNPSYLITIADSEDGAVTSSHTAAKKGDTVTLTVTPEDGYELADLTVTDFWGKDVALTDNGDGTYSFTMPGSQVEIEASFTQAGEPEPEPELPFTDVTEADWFYDEVQYVVDNGLMIGTSDTTFDPNGTTTRAQVVTILYRLEGEPDLSGENLGYPYEDVPADTWYTDAVYWARLNGIVYGNSDTQFDPDDPITREQLAAMLYRYAQYKGYDVTATGDLSGFADADTVSGWAQEAVSWSVGAGLIQGDENGLTPTSTAIRAQIAAILMRFCENVTE